MIIIEHGNAVSLPKKALDCVNRIIQLRKDVDKITQSNFGLGKYVFTLSKHPELQNLHINHRIRLFPLDEYPHGRVHALACMVGYDRLQHLFQVVGEVKISE